MTISSMANKFFHLIESEEEVSANVSLQDPRLVFILFLEGSKVILVQCPSLDSPQTVGREHQQFIKTDDCCF